MRVKEESPLGSSTLPRLSDLGARGAQSQPHRSPRGARPPHAVALWVVLGSVLLAALAGIALGPRASAPFVRQRRTLATPPRPTAVQTPLLTPPDPQGAAFGDQRASIDPPFRGYYTAHDGQALLGQALTPALPLPGGWVQFFVAGALYEPGSAPVATSSDRAARTADGQLEQLIATGEADPTTGVIRLPLLQALLAAGSQVTIGDSALAYADLRVAAQPDHLVAAPDWYRANAPNGPTGTFIPEELRTGTVLGHLVPTSFWNALADPAVAPDGWAIDFGRPLTEALTAAGLGDQTAPTSAVQLFEHGALVLDPPASGSPSGGPDGARPVPVGLDYLRTFGPPTIAVAAGVKSWARADAAVHAVADASSPALAHLGPSAALTTLFGAKWLSGTLWYHVASSMPSGQVAGWIEASSVTFAAPGAAPISSAFAALDPALATYLTGLGQQVGVVVDDLTQGVTYGYGEQRAFIVASSIKVPIMLALLGQLEARNQTPSALQRSLLTAMIEHSDNAAAQTLYDEIGDAAGLTTFMQHAGVAGLQTNPNAWGWSTTTPLAMAQLLALLDEGKLLTTPDRDMALDLMQHVESDEQIGVGTAAPAGATVALKDGWVQGPDGLWAMNSSGIVATEQETFVIAVYTEGDQSLDQGWSITQHICQAVAQAIG